MTEDNTIIEMLWNRSKSAVDALSRKYGGYCYRIAYNILASREDSEECVNDTYLKVWNVIPPNRPQNFPGFLGKLTRGLALDKIRLRTRKKRGGGQYEAVLSELAETLSSNESVERHIEDEEITAALNRFVSSLDDESRTAFVLRYFGFYSIEAVGKKIGGNENRVQYLLRKTRAALKNFLEKEELL